MSATTSRPLTAENRPPTASQSHLVENKLQNPFTNNPPPEISAPPHVCVPVSSLQDLAASLTAFQGCFSNLQHHLNYLKMAVDSLITIPLHKNANILVSPPPTNESTPQSPPVETQPAGQINKTAGKLKENSPAITEPAGEINVKAGKKPKAWASELDGLCRDRCSEGVRTFIASKMKLRDNRLREEVPKALKLVPNLAKFVLECAGKFFMLGREAYADKHSPAATGRKASVMILESYFLMRDGENGTEIETEKAVKEEADESAVSWKTRMVSEGGVIKASEVDARGLLFWIGCFGLPATFTNEDVRNLLLASNPRAISALRKSSALMKEVPEVIDWMIKNNMPINAIDIAYIFGLENTIDPRTMLISFLQECRKTWEDEEKAAKGSPIALHEANKKKLTILRSVKRCVEVHKIDPKVLSEWNIKKMISSTGKSLGEFYKKRIADEAESSKELKPQEVKRLRYNGQGLLQHQIAAGHVDSQRHFLESGPPGHINNYCAPPSMFHSPGAGTAPYAGGYGGMFVESPGRFVSHNAYPYEYRGDPALTERLVSHSYAGQPPSSSVNGLSRPYTSLDGYGMVPNTSSVGVPSRSADPHLYEFADAVVE